MRARAVVHAVQAWRTGQRRARLLCGAVRGLLAQEFQDLEVGDHAGALLDDAPGSGLRVRGGADAVRFVSVIIQAARHP